MVRADQMVWRRMTIYGNACDVRGPAGSASASRLIFTERERERESPWQQAADGREKAGECGEREGRRQNKNKERKEEEMHIWRVQNKRWRSSSHSCLLLILGCCCLMIMASLNRRRLMLGSVDKMETSKSPPQFIRCLCTEEEGPWRCSLTRV